MEISQVLVNNTSRRNHASYEFSLVESCTFITTASGTD